MSFLKKSLHVDMVKIPNYGKFILRPTQKAIYSDVDGCPYAVWADTLYRRRYRWEQNHYTLILPGLTEWAERYRRAFNPTDNTVYADFDWRGWHRDGLLFTKEIFRKLPRHIPVHYAKPLGDNSGLVEDFEVTEEQIDDLLLQLGDSQTEREPVIADSIVVGVKDEDGQLCIRFKVKGKSDSFTFSIEYYALGVLKDFLERIAKSENEIVAWESGQGENGMYFYPQTIGGLRPMGQLHIFTEGKNKPDFTAYLNIRHFVRSLYRTIMTNLNELPGDSVYKQMQSNLLEWYIDDSRYEHFSFLRKKPSLAKWLTPTITKVKDYFADIYNTILDDDV